MAEAKTVVYLGAPEGFEAAQGIISSVGVLQHIPAEQDKVAEAMRSASALLDASMKVRITDEMVDAAPNLRIISTATTGADHVSRVELDRRGIPYTLTPGVPAFAAAAAVLECELTVPEVAQSVVLTRVPGRASKMPEREKLESFAATGTTLAIHLAIQTLPTIVETLLPHYGASCPAAVVAHASQPNETIVRGSLGTLCADVQANPIERTAMILVGPALGASELDADAFKESSLYDPDYRRRYRGGPA